MLHVSRRVNTGFSPRNKLAMKPGAKLSSTAISARARAMSPALALQAIIRHGGLVPDAKPGLQIRTSARLRRGCAA